MCLNERLTGFGPVTDAWQAPMLPLHHNRTPVFSGETVTHLVHCTLTGLAPVQPASLGVLLLLELSGDTALLRTSYRYAASTLSELLFLSSLNERGLVSPMSSLRFSGNYQFIDQTRIIYTRVSPRLRQLSSICTALHAALHN